MIKTWQQRCEEHPDHAGIVSEGMIRERMQEEIDELRQSLFSAKFLPEDMDAYERGFIDGMQEQRRSTVDKAVRALSENKHNPEYDFFPWSFKPPPQKQWIGLTDEEIKEIIGHWGDTPIKGYTRKLFDQIEAKLREKNS